MSIDDLPLPRYVLDLETLVVATIDIRSNATLSTLTGMIETGNSYTITRVRSAYKRHTDDDSWDQNGLPQINVQNVTSDLTAVTREMMEICGDNGIDTSLDGINDKLFLIALAKQKNCCVVSVDNRITSISMHSLCDMFDVDFVYFHDVE